MAKVTIFKVPVSDKVAQILDEGVTTITSVNTDEIRFAITQQKQIKELQEKRVAQQLASVEKMDNTLKALHERLKDGPATAVELHEMCRDIIPTTSSMTARLKQYLSDVGETRKIKRGTRQKMSTYWLEAEDAVGAH